MNQHLRVDLEHLSTSGLAFGISNTVILSYWSCKGLDWCGSLENGI